MNKGGLGDVVSLWAATAFQQLCAMETEHRSSVVSWSFGSGSVIKLCGKLHMMIEGIGGI